MRSKVLAVYVVENQAKLADKLLCEVKSPRYQHISYRNSTLEEKLSVHHKNIKKYYKKL